MNGLMNGLMFLDFNCVTDCGGADILRIIKFVFILLDLVFFIVPIGLIVMIMIDFSKNVIAGKEDEMKKNLNVAIKRIIYCIVLFLVPTIVNFAVGLVSNTGDNIVAKASYCVDYAKNEDLSICEVDYDNFEKKNINCWQCQDETGYVRSFEIPKAGYTYYPSTSFNYTADTCAPGFKAEPVNDYFCEHHERYVCSICADEGSNIYVWNNEKPLNTYQCNRWDDYSLETKDACAKLAQQDKVAEKGEITPE